MSVLVAVDVGLVFGVGVGEGSLLVLVSLLMRVGVVLVKGSVSGWCR